MQSREVHEPYLPSLAVGVICSIVAAACMPACKTGSATASSGITTLEPTKHASALSPIERQTLCRDYAHYIDSKSVVEVTNEYLCKMQAFFGATNAATDDAARATCLQRYDQCMASYAPSEGQTSTQSDDCGAFDDNLDDCEATVEQLFRCEVDINAAREEIAEQDWCSTVKAGPGQTFPTSVSPVSCDLGQICPRYRADNP